MLRKTTLTISALLILASANVQAIEACKTSLAQHSTDKNKTGKPALILYTNSKDEDLSDEDKESYSIDAAISLNCASSDDSTSEYLFAVEGHKNDLTSKESDSLAFRAGWSLELSEYAFLATSLAHVTDNVKNTKSIQVIADVDFYSEDYYINNYYLGSSWAFTWSPVLAVEYENFIDAEDSKEGNVIRAMFGVGAQLHFFENKEKEFYRVVVDINHTYWNNLSDDDKLVLPDDHEQTTFEARYIIDKSDSFEVSLAYKWSNGEDIRNKLADQEYEQVGLGLNFSF